MTIQGQSIRPADGSASTLPAEIAFLAGHGIGPDILIEAGWRAWRAGVSADTALIRGGLVSEEVVYRALAAELDLPFTLDLAVHALARFPHCVLTGIVPLSLDDTLIGFAYAPPPGQFAEVLARGSRMVPGLAITTPTALRRAVMATRAASIADKAADGLCRLYPDLSARFGVTTAQAATLVAGSALLTGLSLLEPSATWLAICAALGLFFLANAAFRLASLNETVPVAPVGPVPRRRERDLPVYTVLVPIYREARVLPKLVAALDALDYPKAKLDVKLLVEVDDDETLAALDALDPPGWLEVVVVPAGEPRTKPRALNAALPLARGEYLTIFDAEDVPDPGQLRLAVEIFTSSPPDIACLQARLVIDNTDDGVLTRLFTLEYAALFDVINPALARFDLPIPLGGTSNHLRTAVIQDLGGWDSWNVTEDADLGIRLAASGHRIADLPSSTLEEAPAHLRAWIRQRRRWTKGFLQVAITHSRRPWRSWRRLGTLRFLAGAVLTFGTVGSSLGYPFFAVLVTYDLARGDLFSVDGVVDEVATSFASVLFMAGLLAMTLPALEGARRRRLWSLMPFVALMPFYYFLVSWAAWRGLADLVLDPYRWLKTEHGLARTSRSGPPPGGITDT